MSRFMALGHHFKLLVPLRICGTDASYKVQILCANALRAVIACGSKINAGMRRVSQNIIPRVKKSAPPLT